MFDRLLRMASWSEFAADAPRLAEAIRILLQQYGPGLGYLATVRADGGPRVHPVSPVITDEGLFCFVVDSPKRRDLERDGRYALHSFPPEESDDEAYVAGRAQLVTDPARIARLAATLRAAPRSTGACSSSPSRWRCWPGTAAPTRSRSPTAGPGGTGRACRSGSTRPALARPGPGVERAGTPTRRSYAPRRPPTRSTNASPGSRGSWRPRRTLVWAS